MAWTSVVPMEILRSIWILDMFWKKVVFYIAVLTHYYKQWLKTTQLIISQFSLVRVQAWRIIGSLLQVVITLKSRCPWVSLLIRRLESGRTFSQAHLGCWQRSLPCDSRTPRGKLL